MANTDPPPPGTRLVPLGVPQVHAYPIALKNIYFVRDCYEECYNEVCSAIDEGKTLINVTGTPGIGKSVFYMYVLQRFREEKDDIKKIVTASYDEGKELERKIWIRGENGDSDDLYRKSSDNDEEDCKYYLYDGVPNHPPTEPEKGRIMICFSNPNTNWLRKLRRRPMEYAECYMPGWAFDELRMANVALGWEVTEEALVRRWKHFGGTARFTLGHADVETFGMAEFRDAINKIQSLDDVLDFFQNDGGHSEKVIHRLLHFDVKTFRVLNDQDFPALKPGTDYVGFKISEKLDAKLDDERKKLMNWLDGHGKPATFLGWLFENYAHEKLLGGITLQLRDLATDAASEETFSQGDYQRFSVSLPLSQALLQAYRSPHAQNLRSIDSYKLHNGTLWLFQITRNMDHAVHTEGILDLLKHLRLLETFLAGTTTVKLLFIVPARLESTFPRQVYEMANVYKAEASLADVYSYGCESVPGIGPNKKLKLEGSGIRTVRDLLGAYDENKPSVSLVRKNIEDFKAVLEVRTVLTKIAKIPQQRPSARKWHGLCLGILQSLDNLREELIAQETQFVVQENADGGGENKKQTKKNLPNRQSAHRLADHHRRRMMTVNNHISTTDILNTALAVGSFATTRQAMTGAGVTSAMGASYSQAINTSLQTIPVVGAAFSVGCMAMDANSMAASVKLLNTPAKKAIALSSIRPSFVTQVPHSISQAYR